MKKFVTAVLSVLLVASMATAALANAFVPSVEVKEVTTDSTVGITDAEGNTQEVAVIADGSALDAEVPAIRVTMVASSLDTENENGLTEEQNAFATDVFNGIAEAESFAAYLGSFEDFTATADLTDYVVSALLTVEASDALKALLGDQKVSVTFQVPGVEEGMEVYAVILEQVDGQTVVHPVEAVVTADGVVVTTDVFGVLVIAVK